MGFLDRLLTIVVTATLTSAVWIVIGSTYVDRAAVSSVEPARPAAVQTEPAVDPDSDPEPDPAGPLLVPVAGVAAAQLADTFDVVRGGGGRRHEALDIMAPAGTPVVAAAAGTVEKLFRSDEGGNTVYVRSADRRTIYYYAHLQAYASGLREGQAVARGERLGTVGSTGNADPAAPHLHFAVMRTAADADWWEPARAVNPYQLLQSQRLAP